MELVFEEVTRFDEELGCLIYRWRGYLLGERRTRCIIETTDPDGPAIITRKWLGVPGGVRYGTHPSVTDAQDWALRWARRRQREK